VIESSAIDDEEFLYRKASVNSGWYDSEKEELKPDAFKPRADDGEGISLDRAKSAKHPEFRSLQEAAQGASPRGYYIAVFRVGDLRSNGFTVAADFLDGNPGHALLTDLTYANRRSPSSLEKMNQLAHKLVVRVEGPFNSESDK